MKTNKSWLVVVMALVAVALMNTGCFSFKSGGSDRQAWTGSNRPTGPADGSIHERHRLWEFEDPFTWIGGLVDFNVNVNSSCNYGTGAAYNSGASYRDYANDQWCPVGQHIEHWGGRTYRVQNGFHCVERGGQVTSAPDSQGAQTLYGQPIK